MQSITSASFWAKGNNAIAIIYDEGNSNVQGGGQVATVVVTSHGPRRLQAPPLTTTTRCWRPSSSNFGVACLAKPATPRSTTT